MRKLNLFILLALALILVSCSKTNIETFSPDKKNKIEIFLYENQVKYKVFHADKLIIDKSSIKIELENNEFLGNNLNLINYETKYFDEVWEPVWGTDKEIRNSYNETTIKFQTSNTKEEFIIVARAYNDGVAFRYIIPNPENKTLNIVNENTEFNFAQNDTAWWIPHDEFAYESLYKKSLISEIKTAASPLTIRTNKNIWLCIHEAALLNYSEMYLKQTEANSAKFTTSLWQEPNGISAKIQGEFKSPWRSIHITESAEQLAESHLIQNLNEACKIENTTWIKPIKFIGIWWSLHKGKHTWYEGEKHGATTERTKKHIDFASKNNIEGVIAEGWNKGWETWAGTLTPTQDFTSPAGDFDIFEIVEYAKQKNVNFMSHHETGGNIPMYESQLDTALALCNVLGIRYLKTGYAGNVIPEGYPHHGQFMVNHFQKVVEMAAKYNICLNVHESIKPTGLDRTWPNLMTQEAIRGNEWNATYRATPPYHSCILPFTRFVAGPADYTTGIFKIIHSSEQNKRLYTTTSHQMALLTVFYSPMLMFADEIENYENSKAFHFIKDIPATWHKTKFLKSEPGEYVCVARNYENKWFVAAVTNEYSRLLKIPMDFLSDNINYIAEICCDTKHTNWETNPESIEIYKIKIKNTDTIMAALAGTGGFNMKIYIDNDNSENSISIQEFNQHSLENYEIFAKAKVLGEKHTDNLSYNKPVKYNTNFSSLYPASGKTALTDGIKANYDYRENWQGFYYDNLNITIDLEQETKVSSVEISFLESPHDWIFKPKKVSAYKSIDGENFKLIAEKTLKDNAEINPHLANIYNINFDVENTEARYIKIIAENIKTCPNWHVGKGQKAWLFCDEIIVK